MLRGRISAAARCCRATIANGCGVQTTCRRKQELGLISGKSLSFFQPRPYMATQSKAPVAERTVPRALRPLRYVGIPDSVLSWKPRLPSRNWSIFWVSVAAVSYLYYEDRRQCKKILDEYKDRVRGLSEDTMQPLEHPRKVLVYTAKYPGDNDYEKGLQFFKRYVKPVLVAAAVDYEIVSGTRYGNLARELRDRIHQRRRNLAGLESWTTNTTPGTELPSTLTPAQHLQRELDGGVVLVGRPALKEWAWALKEGWCTNIPTKAVDYDDRLATELAEDNAFDEVVPAEKQDESLNFVADEKDDTPSEASPVPTPGFLLPTQAGFKSISQQAMAWQRPPASGTAPVVAQTTSTEPEALLPPVSPIPAQPPICFVDYTNFIGWRNIPLKIGRFFNNRKEARIGAEAGLSIVLGTKRDAREFEPGSSGAVATEPPQGGDLDWGLQEETYYPKYAAKTVDGIYKERENFYEALRRELKATREISRGEREPTKSEQRSMPKTEIELRHDRFEKERQWRNSEQGYNIVKPDAGVQWDESWRGSLRVFRTRDAGESVPSRKQPDVEDQASAVAST